MDASVNLLSKKLNISKSIALRKLNEGAHSGLDFLSSRELNELTKLLELDWELYEYGTQLFSQRLKDSK